MSNYVTSVKARMKVSIRKKVLLYSLIMLLVIGVTGYAVYKSDQKLLKAEYSVQHTEHVINLSDNILSFSKDIESATRGFVITNDSTFLEPLYNAQKSVFVCIGQLRQLTHDNASQQPPIDSLDFYMHRRLDFSLQTIALKSKHALIATISYTKEGKGYSDHLRQIINSIQQVEKALLEQRRQTNKLSVRAFNSFLEIMFVLMIASAFLLLITTRRYLLQNKEKDSRAAELVIANKELVFQNEEKQKRAAELTIANMELVFHNYEKEKRAAELVIANKELVFQNEEKEKRAAELTIANMELAFQNDEKEKRASELVIANRELESFSYSVSHDLRGPLRAISGNAKVLEEDYAGKFDAAATWSLHSLVSNSKKMGMLIDDLLKFSQLGRKEVTVSEIDMNMLVKSVVEEVFENNENKTELILKILPPANGDRMLINQVWINLISNAVKYSKNKPKPNIEIGAYEKDNLIVYYVKDNGIGFDMQYYDKLFGVFQRLHSQEEFEGTGIGLAIVQKIVQRHSGTVWAESKLNEGTCFYFSLPAVVVAGPDDINS